MERVKTMQVKKNNEVYGEHEVQPAGNTAVNKADEAAGAGPSISRNPMRGIEDMVEQNDNNFDGVINNVKVEPADPDLEQSKEDKKSVLEKLNQQNRTALSAFQEKKVKKECCFEREMV